MQSAFSYGFLALGICTILHLLALTFFPRLTLLDRPEKYGLARPPLPYPTGILSVLTFLLLFGAMRPELTFQDKGLLGGIVLLAIITFLDDRWGLPAWVRLLMQALIGFLLFATGTRIYTITSPFGGIIKLDSWLLSNQFSIFPTGTFGNFQFSIPGGFLPVWSGLFTIIWIMSTMNALNWLDGIPGQVSILSFIGAVTIGLLSLSSRVHQPEIALIAFMLAGCALASVLFDFPPNRVVMGDTGAMFFGLLLGTITIYAGGKVATAFLVLGVPLTDFFLVILQRLAKGQSIFRGNTPQECLHLHHRLRAKGWTERQVIALTIAIGGAFGVMALFLSTLEKFLAILLLLLLITLLTWYSRDRTPELDAPSQVRR